MQDPGAPLTSNLRTARTARLDLVATTREHLDAELTAPGRLAELLGAVVPPGWPPGLYDEDAMRFFHERLGAEGPPSVGWYGWYAILRGDDGERRTLVASGGYFGPPSNGDVEIGYSVVESYRRRGIAAELIRALIDRARGTAGISRIVAHAAAENIASHAALFGTGFQCVGAGAEPGVLRFELAVSSAGDT